MKSKRIDVDILGICSISHKCTGCAGASKSCCASYEVTINGKELQNIVDYIPAAARFCSNLKSKDGYDNVFEQISNDLFCIDTHDDGTCVLAYQKDNKLLCSLHTVAEKYGISFKKVKPESCLLWPLALVDGKKRILSIQDGALEFLCNKRTTKDVFTLCSSIAMNIERNFGKDVRMKIQEAAGKRVKWISVLL